MAKNICHICGASIWVGGKRDPYQTKMLEETDTAECNVCTPASSWRRFKGR